MKKIYLGLMLAMIAITTVLVSAALVDYLSNTVTEEITVQSPISIDEDIGLELSIEYSGDDDFALIKITNNAERDITGDIELMIGPDLVGISTAITEDINYCFKSQGDMTGITDCETQFMIWMDNNADWNDWYANENYDPNVFFSDLVVNTNDDSFHNIGYTNDTFILPGINFPADETVYGVLYIATDPALQPTTYDFAVTVVPTI